MDNLADKLKEIADNLKGKKTEKVVSKTKPVRGKNGGVRPNSGRKPNEEKLVVKGIKQLIDNFTNEEVEVQIMDREKATVIKMKKPRIIALLEMLYQEAMKNKNVIAAKEVLDRSLGKAPQKIQGDSDAPLVIVDVSTQLNKVYGSETD